MEAAGDFVALAAELAARVKDGKNDFNRRNFFLWMFVDRNTAAVVYNRNGVVLVNGHVDLRAESGQSLVDGVVDDLIDQMVKTTRTSGANVHARTFADRFQALEHLDIRTIVMAGVFLCHVRTPFLVLLTG